MSASNALYTERFKVLFRPPLISNYIKNADINFSAHDALSQWLRWIISIRNTSISAVFVYANASIPLGHTSFARQFVLVLGKKTVNQNSVSNDICFLLDNFWIWARLPSKLKLVTTIYWQRWLFWHKGNIK